MATSFDVVVLGAGPGGYIAAIRAAQLGFSTACVDDWKNVKGGPALGGTCTNIGCIPSKALLQSSEHFEQAQTNFAEHGIDIKGVSLNHEQFLARKDRVVAQNNDGIVYLFKKNKITSVLGHGSFAARTDAGVEIKVGAETLLARHVIVATGSTARALPGVAFDEEKIVSNDGALRLAKVPKKLGVVGAGVIGLEMGSVWRRLGAEVTMLEALPDFLGAVDQSIAREAQKVFAKQGLKFNLGVQISTVAKDRSGVTVSYRDASGAETSLKVDVLIVS